MTKLKGKSFVEMLSRVPEKRDEAFKLMPAPGYLFCVKKDVFSSPTAKNMSLACDGTAFGDVGHLPAITNFSLPEEWPVVMGHLSSTDSRTFGVYTGNVLHQCIVLSGAKDILYDPVEVTRNHVKTLSPQPEVRGKTWSLPSSNADIVECITSHLKEIKQDETIAPRRRHLFDESNIAYEVSDEERSDFFKLFKDARKTQQDESPPTSDDYCIYYTGTMNAHLAVAAGTALCGTSPIPILCGGVIYHMLKAKRPATNGWVLPIAGPDHIPISKLEKWQRDTIPDISFSTVPLPDACFLRSAVYSAITACIPGGLPFITNKENFISMLQHISAGTTAPPDSPLLLTLDTNSSQDTVAEDTYELAAINFMVHHQRAFDVLARDLRNTCDVQSPRERDIEAFLIQCAILQSEKECVTAFDYLRANDINYQHMARVVLDDSSAANYDSFQLEDGPMASGDRTYTRVIPQCTLATVSPLARLYTAVSGDILALTRFLSFYAREMASAMSDRRRKRPTAAALVRASVGESQGDASRCECIWNKSNGVKETCLGVLVKVSKFIYSLLNTEQRKTEELNFAHMPHRTSLETHLRKRQTGRHNFEYLHTLRKSPYSTHFGSMFGDGGLNIPYMTGGSGESIADKGNGKRGQRSITKLEGLLRAARTAVSEVITPVAVGGIDGSLQALDTDLLVNKWLVMDEGNGKPGGLQAAVNSFTDTLVNEVILKRYHAAVEACSRYQKDDQQGNPYSTTARWTNVVAHTRRFRDYQADMLNVSSKTIFLDVMSVMATEWQSADAAGFPISSDFSFLANQDAFDGVSKLDIGVACKTGITALSVGGQAWAVTLPQGPVHFKPSIACYSTTAKFTCRFPTKKSNDCGENGNEILPDTIDDTTDSRTPMQHARQARESSKKNFRRALPEDLMFDGVEKGCMWDKNHCNDHVQPQQLVGLRNGIAELVSQIITPVAITLCGRHAKNISESGSASVSNPYPLRAVEGCVKMALMQPHVAYTLDMFELMRRGHDVAGLNSGCCDNVLGVLADTITFCTIVHILREYQGSVCAMLYVWMCGNAAKNVTEERVLHNSMAQRNSAALMSFPARRIVYPRPSGNLVLTTAVTNTMKHNAAIAALKRKRIRESLYLSNLNIDEKFPCVLMSHQIWLPPNVAHSTNVKTNIFQEKGLQEVIAACVDSGGKATVLSDLCSLFSVRSLRELENEFDYENEDEMHEALADAMPKNRVVLVEDVIALMRVIFDGEPVPSQYLAQQENGKTNCSQDNTSQAGRKRPFTDDPENDEPCKRMDNSDKVAETPDQADEGGAYDVTVDDEKDDADQMDLM